MVTFFLPLLLAQAVPAPAPAPTACAYDRAAMLALDHLAFDQDMAGGWRRLSNAGCAAEAADLIRDWLAAHPETDAYWRSVLDWHGGQMRAMVGDDARAVPLLAGAKRETDEIGWNHYVDGTVAFLRRDRAGLRAARARLAAVPRPAGYDPRGPDGRPRVVHWPLNLGVLDALDACWDRPYREAYACPAPGR